MADSERREAQRRRAGARERRRSLTTEPFEELDERAKRLGKDTSGGLTGTAKAAAVAALAGGLAGAAKALLERRRASKGRAPDDVDESDDAGERRSQEPHDEAPPDEAPLAAEPALDEDSEDEGAVGLRRGESEQRPEPEDGDEPLAQHDERDREDRAADDEDEDDHDGDSRYGEQRDHDERGASNSNVAQIVGRARTQIEQLLGSQPERVSGVDRSDGSWHVTVEVVELRRIPDSTDVLSSYEVVLDEDGNLVRLERRRRYRRAQVEEG
jgi:hypothetical protein